MLFSGPKLLRAFGFFLAITSVNVQGETADETAEYLAGVIGQYNAFPPIDSDPNIWKTGDIKPIDVFAIQTVLSVDSIDPGNSEFTATTRTSYYWTAEDCNQTKAHAFACGTTLAEGSGLRFFSSATAKALPTKLLSFSEENIHSTVFEEDGRTDLFLNAEQVETRAAYSQSYDMRYFPWEIHALEIPLTTLYTTNVVKLTRFPDNVETVVTPRLPNGWEYLGTQCESFVTSDTTRTSIDQDNDFAGIEFSSYNCLVVVARSNPGWWVTSFLLFSALIMMAYAGSVGITSHLIAEARDDRDAARRALFDGTRLVGTYTVGLLLTYVFQVQISPYGQSIEYWPRIPTSTMIYVVGLVGIIVQSFAGLIGSIIFTWPLLAEGFDGGMFGPYNLDKIPIEGEVGEDRAPLILKRYDPEPPKRKSQLEESAVKSKTWESEEQPAADATPKEREQPVAQEEQPAADGGAKPEEPNIEEGKKEVEGHPTGIPRTRKNNQKTYGVLSVQEAIYINRFVKQLFFFKTGLLVSIAVVALIILALARAKFGDSKAIVAEILENK